MLWLYMSYRSTFLRLLLASVAAIVLPYITQPLGRAKARYTMALSFDLLPIELQASVVDLRAAQVDEAVIDLLIERALKALSVKTNKVQVDVWEMEERLGAQLEQIGIKLQADLQSQHGETNGMLADLNTAWLNARPMIEEAGRGIAELKKQLEELGHWRSRIEAAILNLTEFREESTADRQQIRDELRQFNRRLSEIERLLEVAGNNHEAGR